MAEATRNGGSSTAPKLSYKYQRLRERLRTAIDRGELSGRLPGERALARRYGANAKTVNKALNDLATEGVLVRHVGRGTCVARDLASDPVLGRTRSYRWIVGRAGNHAFRSRAFDRALAAAQSNGHELILLELDLDETGALPDGALSPGQLREIDGLVVYATRTSTPFLADLIRRHIPFVLANTLSDEATTNTVNPDYARGAFELAEHLIGLGHQHIRLVMCRDETPAMMLAELGYETAMRRHHYEPADTLMLPCDHGATEHQLLRDALGEGSAVTAAICIGAHAVEVLGPRIGADLPRTLSVAAIVEPGQSFEPGTLMTAYEVDINRIADWSVRLLLDTAPAQRPRQVIVPGSIVQRDSTAAPADGNGVLSHPGEAVI
jgi:LacI family transcriptional regulator